jgi:hypothetical protein
LPALDQCQCCCRYDCLRQGPKAEDRVLAYWSAGLAIGVAGRASIDDIAVAEHDDDSADDAALGNGALDHLVHAPVHVVGCGCA